MHDVQKALTDYKLLKHYKEIVWIIRPASLDKCTVLWGSQK